MPLVILVIGLMLFVSGMRNTQDEFLTLVKSDFTGGQNSNGFLSWMLAIAAIVGIGYYKPVRPISDAFLLLVIIILFLSNKGVASQFVTQTSNLEPATPTSTNAAQSPSTSTDSSGLTSALNKLKSYFGSTP